MKLFMQSIRWGLNGRGVVLKLVSAFGIIGLSAAVSAFSVSRSSAAPPTSQFTFASLQGDYAYANNLSNVASYGMVYFDGRGGLITDRIKVNKECSSCEGNRTIAVLENGIGSYEMNPDGTGFFTITFSSLDSNTSQTYSYTYEFVVTRAVELGGGKRLAIDLFSPGRTGGLEGQLFAPTLSRLVVPQSSSGR